MFWIYTGELGIHHSTTPTQTSASDIIEEQEWACALCTFFNSPSCVHCEMCMTPRPQTMSQEQANQNNNGQNQGDEAIQICIQKEKTEVQDQCMDTDDEVPIVKEGGHWYELFSVLIHSGVYFPCNLLSQFVPFTYLYYNRWSDGRPLFRCVIFYSKSLCFKHLYLFFLFFQLT